VRTRLLILLLGASSTALAQADGGSGVLTRPPALVQQVEPVYPADAADAGRSASVLLEVDLGPDGAVTAAAVLESGGPGFDQAALAAVRQFRFSPAEVDGAPAAVRLQYRLDFLFRPQLVEVPASPDAGLSNFAGQVVERGTRDPIPFAQVVVGEGEAALTTSTDEAGRFALAGVPPGTWPVRVLASAHQPYAVSEDFRDGERTVVTYFVRKQVYGSQETVVRGQKERKDVAQVTLKQEEIRLIPGTAGDAFRVVQNLPGVARAPFGIGLLIVRGGKSWDTRTFVDEVPVPQLFHFGGLFSTYNASLLEELTFLPGNFNADFGRATGGLVKAEARAPSRTGLHGYLDVNVVDSSALLEGPLSPDWSFALSARRSYIDAVLPAVLNLIPGANDAIRFTLAPRYWDYQGRLEYRHGATRVFISAFGSSDQLVAELPNPSLDPEGRSDFGTSIAYHKLLVGSDSRLAEGLELRTRTSVGIEDYAFTLGKDLYAKSRIFPLVSRDTFTLQLPGLASQLSFGLDLQVFPYTVDVQGTAPPRLDVVPDPFTSTQLLALHGTQATAQPALFASWTWRPLEALQLTAGVRVDHDTQLAQTWVDPRLSATVQVQERVLLKAAVGLYHQPPDYRSGALLPKFGNPGLQAEGALQSMVGTEVRFTDALGLDLQLYEKELFDQVRSTVGDTSGQVSSGAQPPPYLNSGRGRAYGVEVLLRHALTRNFFGWISYSLSRTERDFNGGQAWGLSQFDQPHNLVVVASYKLPLDFVVGVKLRYTSGPLDRPVVATLYDANANYYYPIQDATYSRRLADFFQLDVRLDKRFVFQDWMLSLYLDVQDATYRRNVEAMTYSFDYRQEAAFTGLPILPVLGVRAEW